MRVRTRTLLFPLLSVLVFNAQVPAVVAQSLLPKRTPVPTSATQLAPVVRAGFGSTQSDMARDKRTTASAISVSHNEPIPAAQQVGVPLQPMVALQSLQPQGITLGAMVPGNSTPMPMQNSMPSSPNANVALQPMNRVDERTTPYMGQGTSVPYAVMAMTKFENSGGALQAKAKITTAAMTGPMSDPMGMFSRLEISPLAPAPIAPSVRNQHDVVPWNSAAYTWFSPVFSHRPLYFEQPNLERYGVGPAHYLQPAYSAAHFYGTIGLMPYKLLTQHPREHVYTLGFDRPGNCAAYQGRPWLGQSYFGETYKFWEPCSGY